MSDALRAFVAVPVEAPAVRARLAAAVEGAPRGALKLVPETQLHLTLKFMGELPAASLPAVEAAVASAAAATPRFALELSGLGTFPPRGPARVLWIGCALGRDELLALAARLEGALEEAGVPRDARPFAAHLTLARVKDPRHARAVAELAKEMGAYAAGGIEVVELVLVRSVLGPGGAAHTALLRAKLG